MTAPLAILLIIGAATVGPIEAQPTGPVGSYCDGPVPTTPPVPGPAYFFCRGQWVTEQEYRLASPLETLPQLCERAMREIGVTVIQKVGVSGREGWKGPTHVECLKAPEGYRK